MEKILPKAITLALKAHEGQVDKSGMPYAGHIMRVMAAGRTMDEKIVGVLHDVIEDPSGPLMHCLQRVSRCIL